MGEYLAEGVGAPGGALRCQVFGLRVHGTRNANRGRGIRFRLPHRAGW